MALGLLPVESADRGDDLDGIERIQKSGGPLLSLAFGIRGTGLRRFDLTNQGLADEILECCLSLNRRDFGPLDDFFGQFDGRFHDTLNTGNMGCCQFSKQVLQVWETLV